VLREPRQILENVISAQTHGAVIVVDSRLVTGQAMLDALIRGQWSTSAALVGKGAATDFTRACRVANKQVLSAASNIHRVTQPSHELLGLVRLGTGAQVRAALMAASDYVDELHGELSMTDMLTVILVRAALAVAPLEPTGICERALSNAKEVIALADAQNDEDIRMKRALRSNDGFYSTFVLRKLSARFTMIALKNGWSPNQITLASLGISAVAALFFATGNHTLLAVGALLVQLSIIVDCSDGEVARYAGVSSQLGAWLDAATDRVKEYALYAGLAFGATRNGENLWRIAMALVVLQTVRHLSDYNFVAIRGVRESALVVIPLTQSVDSGVSSAGSLMDTSAALNSRRPIYWLKRVIYLPIGERWLIISVGAFVGSPRLVFEVLWLAGIFGLMYVTFGRVMRSRRWKHNQEISGCEIVERQIDPGFLMNWFVSDGSHPLAGRFGWAVPSILRLVELGVIAAVCRYHHIGYLWLFAVAFHHYDTMYRALAGYEFPTPLARLGLGVEVRTALFTLFAVGFIIPINAALLIGGLYFSLIFVVLASRQWFVQLTSAK
jgi:phosphatidylglycerophosphate synthase